MSVLNNDALAFAKAEADNTPIRRLAETETLAFADIALGLARYHGDPDAPWIAALGQRLTGLRPDLFATPERLADMLRDGSFGELDAVRAAAGQHRYFAAARESDFRHDELLPRIPNAHRSDELPAPLSRNLHKPHCPQMTSITARGVTLFCGPASFQVFDPARGSYARSAANRPLSTAVLDLPTLTVDQPIVVVQDCRPGADFAHFLFDRCTRIFAFAEQSGLPPRECLFVMGGRPGPFHHMVVDALCRLLRADRENFLFPAEDCLLQSTTTTTWFSDTVSSEAQPAQMFRPAATRWLRGLARAVVGEPVRQTRRLYLTGGQTRLPMANEADWFGLLDRLGFDWLDLAAVPPAEQLRLMASASCVVAAHRPELALLAFNEGSPTLVERLDPASGTDTYAFMTKGLGFGYLPVVGAPEQEALRFDVARAEAVLPATLPVPRHATEPQFTVLDFKPGQRWRPGAQALSSPLVDEIAPPAPGLAVLKHLRGTAGDTNVGYWQLKGFRAGDVYCARGFVYVPSSDATEMFLTLGRRHSMRASADLTKRDCWQCLSITGIWPSDLLEANLVLRMDGKAGTFCYSAGWTISGDLSPPDGAAVRPQAAVATDVHLDIRNLVGSVQHFFHFLLSFVVPLVEKWPVIQAVANGGKIYVRSCAIMDPMLLQLKLPRLVIMNPAEHAAMCDRNSKSLLPSNLTGMTIWGYDVPPRYNRRAFETVRRHLFQQFEHEIETERAAIEGSFTGGGPRIVIIERLPGNKFYASADSERKTAGAQRRSIGNFAEACAAVRAESDNVAVIALEDRSLYYQMALFASVDIMICQHGAALANLIWARPGLHLIEVYSRDLTIGFEGVFANIAPIKREILYQDSAHAPIDIAELLRLLRAMIAERAAG